MSDTNETIADIIAEMRALSNPISDGIIAIDGRVIADRLEAAYRREVAELRECLEQAYGDKIGTYTMKGNEVERWHKALKGAEDEDK